MTAVYVVDASVVIKWYLPEEYADSARKLIDKNLRRIAPDLLFPEVGNILWKKVRLGELTKDEASEVLSQVKAEPLDIQVSWPFMIIALEIACNTQRSVYDSLYLALATSYHCQMVTADKKLYNALQNTPLAAYLLWVEDIP